MNGRIDWDDVRAFNAVVEEGSLSAAARLLGTTQPTVGRRIAALETVLGEQLFDRRPDGYALTPKGAALIEKAGEMAAAADGFARMAASLEDRISGTVRIAAGPWAARFLAGCLTELCDELPDVEIEIASGVDFASLSRREADIALRSALPERWRQVARRLRPAMHYAPYAAPSFVAAHPSARDPEHWPALRWIGYDEANAHRPSAQWLSERLNGGVPTLRFSQSTAMLDAAVGGAGPCLLPCFAADAAGLVRLGEPFEPRHGDAFWLVVHADLRTTPRIRAVADAIVALFARHRARLEGAATIDEPPPS